MFQSAVFTGPRAINCKRSKEEPVLLSGVPHLAPECFGCAKSCPPRMGARPKLVPAAPTPAERLPRARRPPDGGFADPTARRCNCYSSVAMRLPQEKVPNQASHNHRYGAGPRRSRVPALDEASLALRLRPRAKGWSATVTDHPGSSLPIFYMSVRASARHRTHEI